MFPVKKFEQHVNEYINSKDMYTHLFFLFIVGHDGFRSPLEMLMLTRETLLLTHHGLQI